jgi:hypothetical protein
MDGLARLTEWRASNGHVLAGVAVQVTWDDRICG